ncbi:hypothetical protein [Alienimonas chondri]|uniref:Uncharacterized protein n=1 Tax=Alienimonas chondri TaxID=2681879 RepID=A0ABX1VEW6_9PLAN|nr:hypothetical protein [Alienimonas chondri]NNJ25591.1 hypothetical protein [Alienimonas chondri]
MDAPAARRSLFQFDRPAPPPATAPDVEAPLPRLSQQAIRPQAEGDVRREDFRAVGAWRGPMLACGVTIAATAGLAYAVLAPEAGQSAKPTARPPADVGGVILASAAEPADETTDAAPCAKAPAKATGSPASPVVSALHVSDGRPVRAVPTDVIPDPIDAGGRLIPGSGVIRGDGVVPAGGPAAQGSALQTGGVTPAVWLTGEIAE